jgi:quinol monooxygenase YgiN
MAEVLELRQYPLDPGSAEGRLLGEFRDLDDEDRVVALRALPAPPDPAPDALLLRPVTDLDLSGLMALVTVTLYHLPPGGEEKFLDFFDAAVAPLLTATGAPPLAVLRTPDPSRDHQNVVAWIASFEDRDALLAHVRTLGREPRWTHETLPELTRRLARPPEQLQLTPR